MQIIMLILTIDMSYMCLWVTDFVLPAFGDPLSSHSKNGLFEIFCSYENIVFSMLILKYSFELYTCFNIDWWTNFIFTLEQAINDRILSLNYEDYTAEIKTADAQDSYEKGVIVLVTGCLTGKDNVKKKFTQTFFLAPQDKGGYFVLNDVFRFVEENESLENNSDSVVNETAPTANVTEAPGCYNSILMISY